MTVAFYIMNRPRHPPGQATNVSMHGQTIGNAGTYTTSHDIVILNAVKSDSNERREGSRFAGEKSLRSFVKTIPQNDEILHFDPTENASGLYSDWQVFFNIES